ncbi:hypothetical protein AVEN_71341-1 [Araneus ventricosus]|uniref:Uncharacterized protein n=1 Tax=Araneus ventricosus TaxID=182803 RepID=A0A4Y2BHF5_ARAVE|nr:hypothetical protein AVEN_71341-1 [Araneus ventricosus]
MKFLSRISVSAYNYLHVFHTGTPMDKRHRDEILYLYARPYADDIDDEFILIDDSPDFTDPGLFTNIFRIKVQNERIGNLDSLILLLSSTFGIS